MSFVVPDRPTKGSASPEALFRDLSRAPNGPQHLWAHQADLLRSYARHIASPDLALELPTGAGKTLVGMLIAEWRRRERSERVVYVCPTKQLARQASADAGRAGIETVDLTGSSQRWSATDEMRYRQGGSVAVATYHAIFNSAPRLDDAHVLLFDDAHAAAGPVASAWSVTFSRDEPAFSRVLNLLAEGLDPTIVLRLESDVDDPRDRRAGYLVDPRVVATHLEALSEALDVLTAGSTQRFAWEVVRESLLACQVFFSTDELLIRPWLPPTSTHAAFIDARQRLYLSATLGSGGELERAFGRPEIHRLPVPEGWDERGTGRRFFIFPELSSDVSGVDGDTAGELLGAFVRESTRTAGRSVLLAPSRYSLEGAEENLVPDGVPIVSANDIAEIGLDAFTSRPQAVLALANRYDGIDLPDGVCRLIVLAGLPVGADVQERFLAFTLGAKRVLQERMRTRLIQGAGRATRNANDWAAIITIGRDLIAFCGRRDAHLSTHPEVRAEIEFGLANSQGRSLSLIAENLTHFLAQDEMWRDQAEPAIGALRAPNDPTADADGAALAAAARAEVRAVDSAWRGDWQRAVQLAEQAISALAGGAELRPYQALWNYLGASWATIAAQTDPSFASQAEALRRAAEAAAARTTWLPRQRLLDAGTQDDVDSVDLLAAEGIVRAAGTYQTRRQVNSLLDQTIEDLSATEATMYERGLVSLGQLLGAVSDQPRGDARADALWRWEDELWVAWEAKSAATPTSPLSAAAVRQANTHLRAAAADFDTVVPPGSFAVLVTPAETIDDSVRPLAEENLLIVGTASVLDLARDVAAIWRKIEGRSRDANDDDLLVKSVLREMRQERALPSLLQARLSGRLV